MCSPGLIDELRTLLNIMTLNDFGEVTYRLLREEIETICDRCCTLISKDYIIDILNNGNGDLCAHYPPNIFIPRNRPSIKNPSQDLKPMLLKAKFARCRTRFVIPAFSFIDKNICRSSTLSGVLEIYGRQVAHAAGFVSAGSPGTTSTTSSDVTARLSSGSEEDSRTILSRLRDNDSKLAEHFGVKYICDFMVENRKMKYLVPVSSSEKAEDHARYANFRIIPMPYPGSEFFRIWKDSNRIMKGLRFDWSRPNVEVSLQPELLQDVRMTSDVNWSEYITWDLTTLTKHYIRFLLGLLYEKDGGILVHCVSGWDRTPLFVSLLRCLLWADELAHWRLSTEQMLYYTLSYDWFLFGHKLRTRIESGEEILRFAFEFLAEVADDESLSLRKVYDVTVRTDESTPDELDARSQSFVDVQWLPDFLALRRKRLLDLSDTFLSLWLEMEDSTSQLNANAMPIPLCSEVQADIEIHDLPGDIFDSDSKPSIGSQILNSLSTAMNYGLERVRYLSNSDISETASTPNST